MPPQARSARARRRPMLPVDAVLPELCAALRARPNAVLVAPPGAGKTTRAPLALLDEPWVAGGRVLVLEPRRVAARAAARRMASTLGEEVGETVGYRVRLEARVSARTRVEVVTEGVFTRRVLDDPGLEGVAAVLFDEFHERSLEGDLGLAFALDVQAQLRPDLRLLPMSATVDGAAVAALLGQGAPVVESAGRMFPVETRHVGRDPARRFEDDAARLVRRALGADGGDLLAFLPGRAEIRRVAERLAADLADPAVDVVPLHGGLSPAEQDRALAPAAPGRRKAVLATALAQTSLTLEGVRIVVDGGLARVPRYDPARGLVRLETVRVSRAAADQRRGRAGRTQPGVCWRLWEEAQTRSLPAFDRPEIQEADLAGVALDLARWGVREPADLRFLDPPPAAAFAEARALLTRLRALDAAGALTPHGRRLAGLGLPPRLAHMVLAGAAAGVGERAARLAAVVSEPGLGGPGVDASKRLDRFAGARDPRSADARRLAARWARTAAEASPPGAPAPDAPDDGLLLAEAFPERIARRRGPPGAFRLANGRGARLDPADPLAGEAWLAVGELGGGEAHDRILLAVRLDEAALLAAFADRVVTEERVEADAEGRIRARRVRRLGELVVEERGLDAPAPALVARALLARVRAEGMDALSWPGSAVAFRARVAFLRGLDGASWPDLSDAALLATLDDWLAPLLEGRTRLDAVRADALEGALRERLTWEQARRLDVEAPPRLSTPAGASAPIDYAAEGGPLAEVRVQEMFGRREHPTVARGRVPLTLALLSPARRPVQVTRDLPGFWAGSWREVRTEMRGRYPRHPWPEDPLAAAPTTRAKPRGT